MRRNVIMILGRYFFVLVLRPSVEVNAARLNRWQTPQRTTPPEFVICGGLPSATWLVLKGCLAPGVHVASLLSDQLLQTSEKRFFCIIPKPSRTPMCTRVCWTSQLASASDMQVNKKVLPRSSKYQIGTTYNKHHNDSAQGKPESK